jgi:hypothetical protein
MTKPPRWLHHNWKYIAPEELQSGSIEQRAERLVAMHRDDQLPQTPKLLQALALDLLMASLPDDPPEALERLAILALGLPRDHELGEWSHEELDRRGNPDFEARAAAHEIEREYLEQGRDPLGPRALARELKAQGHNTTPWTIREWRKSLDWPRRK